MRARIFKGTGSLSVGFGDDHIFTIHPGQEIDLDEVLTDGLKLGGAISRYADLFVEPELEPVPEPEPTSEEEDKAEAKRRALNRVAKRKGGVNNA